MEKTDHANTILKKAGVAILISMQILKQGKLSEALHNDKGAISQRRHITVLKMYALTKKALKYMRQNFIQLNEEIVKSTVRVGIQYLLVSNW